MMTFSLRPISGSTLPLMAASVSTRVVSWKEAADMKDSVAKEALVIPSRTGVLVAFWRFRRPWALSWSISWLMRRNSDFSNLAAGDQAGCRRRRRCGLCASSGGR